MFYWTLTQPADFDRYGVSEWRSTRATAKSAELVGKRVGLTE